MTTIAHQLKVLFATFPPQSGDVDAQIEAHGIALEGHDPRDIEAAIRKFLRGEVADHNASFAPSAPKLGTVVRQCMSDRLDHERRSNPPKMLEFQEVKKALPEAERAASVKSQLARAGVMIPDKRTPEAIAAAKKREAELQIRHDARFIELTDAAIASRLGYVTGDTDEGEAA